MADLNETRDDEWEEGEDSAVEFEAIESDNVMQFSDYVEPDVKKMQKHRITELRRRAEERQDWKRISHEFDWDLDEDETLEEA
ncbi:MAG: hypothetical protein R3F41_15780 [Gammaproteobacteria bacterium]|nr:hypothetical protein [Pseudomonadales bacterium]MCP5346769.1 hypothetical protein [Pseudomonadales bacterium]